MSATSPSAAFHEDHGARPAPTDPVVHRRRVTAVVLTAIAIAIGVVLVAIAGRDAFLVYWLPLPLAIALLWRSTRDERFDERPA